MKISEIMNSRLDLHWSKDGDLHTTDFTLDGRKYGISVTDEIIAGRDSARVDFHFVTDTEEKQHAATNFNKDAGKIIGIVGNDIRDKFKAHNIIYFAAKRRLSASDEEYQARVKLYSRITQKLAIENSMWPVKVEAGNEYVFGLCKSKSDEELFRSLI